MFECRAFGIVLVEPFVRGNRIGKQLETIGVTGTVSGIDVNPNRRHSSPLSFGLPQCVSLRDVSNTRSTSRFNALMMPRRTIIVGPLSSTTKSKGFDRGLPFLEILLSLRQFHDVVGGIAQSHQPAPTRQQDGIIERTDPGGSGLGSCDQLSAFRDVLSAQVAFFFAASTAALSGQIVPLS
jgi:hypothetical protein